MERLDAMTTEKKNNEIKQDKLQQIANMIKTIEYNNIQKEIIQDFLTPKCSLILDYLRTTNPHLDPSFIDRIPKMIFNGNFDGYIVTIVGLQEHHN